VLIVESSARFGTLLSVFYLPTSALDVQCSMFGVCFDPEPWTVGRWALDGERWALDVERFHRPPST